MTSGDQLIDSSSTVERQLSSEQPAAGLDARIPDVSVATAPPAACSLLVPAVASHLLLPDVTGWRKC